MNVATSVETLVTEHLDLWTAALKRKSTAGRGSSSKVELYGIKKLRELILELAVRGLLVPQDPNDEPASELLKKIAAEKAKLVKAGTIKKDKPLPAISDEAVPFVAPHGWKWARIADIGHDFGQKTPDADFTYIDVGAIDNRLGLIDCPATLMAEDAPSRARKLVSRGTVIYSTVRPYLLNVAIVQKDFDPEPIASTAFAVVHPFEGVVSGYVYRYLRSPSFVAYVESVQTGIAYPAINDRQFFSGLIPLPPTAEQHRIVAKVNELMALCDQLEQETDASLGAHQTLVETLLSALTSAADHAQFASAWQRIAGHFDTLFTTEESIAQLKQTLLQLAVMGRLDGGTSGGWEIQRLDKVCAEIVDCPHSTPKWTAAGKICVRTSQFRPGKLDLSGCRFVSESTFDERVARLKPEPDDILYSREGGILGVACRVPPEVELCLGQRMMLMRPGKRIVSAYLELVLNSPVITSIAQQETTGGAAPRVNVSTVKSYPIPVPPLAEQRRIVAKVDELMALCDQLKSRLSDAQTTQLHLADALVEQAIG